MTKRTNTTTAPQTISTPHIVLKRSEGSQTLVRGGRVKQVHRSIVIGAITAGSASHVLSGTLTRDARPGDNLIGFVENDLNISMIGPKGLPMMDMKHGAAQIGWIYPLGDQKVKISINKNANLIANRSGDVEFKIAGARSGNAARKSEAQAPEATSEMLEAAATGPKKAPRLRKGNKTPQEASPEVNEQAPQEASPEVNEQAPQEASAPEVGTETAPEAAHQEGSEQAPEANEQAPQEGAEA